MTDLPPIADELRPRAKLKKHADAPTSDAEVEANSRQLGERWGASTSLPVLKDEPAPVTSIRGYIPQYLDDELSVRAAERRVTKTFLIMEALAKAGYRVEEGDLIQDRRRRPKG